MGGLGSALKKAEQKIRKSLKKAKSVGSVVEALVGLDPEYRE